MTPTALGSLGKLTREIRDKIYHLLVCEAQRGPTPPAKRYHGLTNVSIEAARPHGIWNCIQSSQGVKARHKCPELLLVCTKINREVMEHIYVYSTLCIQADFQTDDSVALPPMAMMKETKNVLFDLLGAYGEYVLPHPSKRPYKANAEILSRAMAKPFGGATTPRNRCLIQFEQDEWVYEDLPASPHVQVIKTFTGFKTVTLELKILVRPPLFQRGRSIVALKPGTKPAEDHIAKAVMEYETVQDRLRGALETYLGPAECTLSEGRALTIDETNFTACITFHPQEYAGSTKSFSLPLLFGRTWTGGGLMRSMGLRGSKA